MQEKENIIVFGASSGLGKALVEQLSEDGHTVFAASRSIMNTELPDSVKKLPCDITSAHEIKDTFAKVYLEVDAINLVITTAGLGLIKEFEQISDSEIQNLLETGLYGPIRIAQEAYRNMLPQKSGHIITVSSTTGLEGKPNEVVYSAVKQGLRGMNQALSKEASAHNIEATCIFPGGMKSEKFYNHASPGKDISMFMKPAYVSEKIVSMLKEPSPHPVEFVIPRHS